MTCQNPVRRALALVGAALLAFSLVAIGASPAEGQTTVTTEAQLRDAVATDAATIVLGADITLNCEDGPLKIDSATTIRSSSSALRTLSVDGECRIIDVTANVRLTIERLHLTGGHAPNGTDGDPAEDGSSNGDAGTPGEDGGAIRSLGSVTVVDSRFTDNVAGDGGTGGAGWSGVDGDIDASDGGTGGSGGNGGAIHAAGSVTVTNSTFSGNRAGTGGTGGQGGTGFEGADGGAGEPGGNATAGGAGGTGGAGGNGGAISGGTVTIVRSTLTNNASGEGGTGGVGGDGGTGGAATEAGQDGGNGANGGTGGDGGDGGSGGAVAAGTLTLETSTVHANAVSAPGVGGGPGTGGKGGAGAEGGGTGGPGLNGAPGGPGEQGTGGAAHTTGATTIESSTITANTTTDADGARSLNADGTITLDHTAVVGTGPGEDCNAANVDATNSIDGDESCGEADTETDLQLHPLGDNGGDTATRLPQADSPLVDGGAASCPDDTDQRGVIRAQGDNCDIGAVERRGPLGGEVTYTPTDGEQRTGTVGDEITVVFTLTFSGGGVISADDLNVTLDDCPNPRIGGATAPWTGGDAITYTCVVTSDVVDSYMLQLRADFPDGEDMVFPAPTASTFVRFLQATTTTSTTTTTIATTPTSVPPVIGSDTGGSGGALPRTGLSILFTLTAGAALVFGGSSLSKVAKARAEKSPRWNVKYGVPYPVGTHKQRTRDDI